MTIPGRDSSAFLPDDAGLRQAYADGIRLWAGYFAGPGIWVGWPDSNFLRIKAAGMQSLAFCSGGSDPVACRARADRLGILFGTDTEANIPDGGQAWLDTAGTAGAYGGAAVMTRRAAWHIVADYRAIPGDTWPSYLARPAGPLGWQYLGTHSEYGGSVDSSRLDDWFGGTTPALQGDQNMKVISGDQVPMAYITDGVTKRYIGDPTQELPTLLMLCGQTNVITVGQYTIDRMPSVASAYFPDRANPSTYDELRLEGKIDALKAASVGPAGPAGPPGPAVSSVTIAGTFPAK